MSKETTQQKTQRLEQRQRTLAGKHTLRQEWDINSTHGGVFNSLRDVLRAGRNDIEKAILHFRLRNLRRTSPTAK